MAAPAPTYARVASITHWNTFFSHDDGLFRLPSTQGATIEHLDIDLRYVGDDELAKSGHRFLKSDQPVHIPKVCVLTLRGGEYVHDDDTRIDALAEVLLAINPVEVRWLNAMVDPTEQLSFATHLVHPAIIAAGDNWSAAGSLRKLVIQGGFPCPNLTAPTPFSLTPAATPCPSPGPHRTSFGLDSFSSIKGPAHLSSGLPALTTTKPKRVDEERLKARAERRRLADYTLKPRSEYAFGTWSVQELKWRLDGRYTPACIVSIITQFLKAVNTTFPSATRRFDVDLPAVVAFTSLPRDIISELQSLPEKLELAEEVHEWLADVGFGSLGDGRHARLWSVGESAQEERNTARLKADIVLAQTQNGVSIVSLDELLANKSGSDGGLDVPSALTDATGTDFVSPANSIASLLPPQSEGASTEDESEAVTPELQGSPVVEPTVSEVSKKVSSMGISDGERSLENSAVI
ncbi:hypothetical protein L198_05105 [Cryptococcus wingfieldii CBS 7118]|uniref:Uncharacterized protein n=1 Tax=Cryptococcus wingfieldii CBS 7118 TaxID=1295528 RepID=A0A1E3J076_9TREE|nr:hypothetical protein L198_05105 [Cryptococcus wingfieldii CBS 7118]ODN94249.1 hypothetical protein L198_05105 [Cryptococcus wingfieldii CBS 7118]